MKPLADILPPYCRGDDTPMGSGLPAAGALSAMLIDERALNRYTKIRTRAGWRDDDNSHPPLPEALEEIAKYVLRAPARNDMIGPVHAIVHVEDLLPLRAHVTAAQTLRDALPKSTPISIGMFPGAFDPTDEAWADADAVVSIPFGNMYPSNAVCRGGLSAWLGKLAADTARFKRLFPRRRKYGTFLTPGYQVLGDDPEIAPMMWTPTPVADWEAVNVEMRDAKVWTPFFWAPVPPYKAELFVEHMTVFRRVWGLRMAEPEVLVA